MKNTHCIIQMEVHKVALTIHTDISSAGQKSCVYGPEIGPDLSSLKLS